MKKLLALVVPLVVAAAATASPGRFGPHSERVTNAWFPLEPGTTWIYRSVKDGEKGRDVVTVSRVVTTIDGVRCATVEDRLYLGGHLAERTTDWYAQDAAGDVWYYGESTAELHAAGHVTSTEGTWRSGRDGATAGIFMPAHPRVGQAFRQEYFKGHAEDHFRVLRISGRTMLTEEWTPVEPGVLDHKLYRRGVGDVREETVRGPAERQVLVSVRRGA